LFDVEEQAFHLTDLAVAGIEDSVLVIRRINYKSFGLPLLHGRVLNAEHCVTFHWRFVAAHQDRGARYLLESLNVFHGQVLLHRNSGLVDRDLVAPVLQEDVGGKPVRDRVLVVHVEEEREVCETNDFVSHVHSVDRLNGYLDHSRRVYFGNSDLVSESVEGMPAPRYFEVRKPFHSVYAPVLIDRESTHEAPRISRVFRKESGSVDIEVDTLAWHEPLFVELLQLVRNERLLVSFKRRLLGVFIRPWFHFYVFAFRLRLVFRQSRVLKSGCGP